MPMDVALTENDEGEHFEGVRRVRSNAYTPLSPTLAPSLAFLAGSLAALGGLGAWIRVTVTDQTATAARLLHTTMGYRHTSGILIAILGALSACGWVLSRGRPLA